MGHFQCVGERSRLVGLEKQKLLEQVSLKTHHCIIHQEALCGQVHKMDDAMTTMMKTVNFIRVRDLNHRYYILQYIIEEYSPHHH